MIIYTLSFMIAKRSGKDFSIEYDIWNIFKQTELYGYVVLCKVLPPGYKTRSPEGRYPASGGVLWIFRDVRMEPTNDNALTAQSAVCGNFRPMKRETRTSSILTSRKIHPEDSSGGWISGGYPADICWISALWKAGSGPCDKTNWVTNGIMEQKTLEF